MKKYLLPETGQFYKANLHCHTTMSDGKQTPEEIKEAYKAQGYSIVAYTDHRILFPQNHLTDDTFLALNGVEHDVNEQAYSSATKCCHFCCIALYPDNALTPCPNEKQFKSFLEKPDVFARYRPQPGTENFPRDYTPEAMNALWAKIKEYGFFITYNHPDWSLEEPETFCKYVGMNAMEICNNACLTMGFNDYNPHAYDSLLRTGHRIFCIAADDNHALKHSFGGWTMIKADKLEYRTITHALENGHFYASQGPAIDALWIEDNAAHIRCSPARSIQFTTDRRHRKIVHAPAGDTISEASFELDPKDLYFRVTVEDHNGKPANTNAYFLDTLGVF